MAKPSGGIMTSLADMAQQLAAGVSVALTGKTPAWFGPLDPIQPVAPPDTAGRGLDYQSGYNLVTRPRHGELVGFAQMRALADGYDLMRIIIETRKDQMAKLQWTIKPRDVAGTLADESSKPDPRCEVVKQWLRKPDREHDWKTWLRMVLEDLLVLDAPAIYAQMTRGGDLYALHPIDGATIKRVIDQWGRTPMEGTAYQQILKGVAAVDYTRDELIYMPRNVRTHKIYGYSPVEQIITTVNLALMRQLHQVSYFSKGSTPDLIFTVPESWTITQIQQFQDWWNLLLEGDIEARRGTKFVPNGVAPVNTKDKALKDEFDEWLARIVCFAFSISPQPFIKEMNRATAQTNLEQSLSEGLAPLMDWVKTLMDEIIERYAAADLEFIWVIPDQLSPKDQAEVDGKYVQAGVLTADEVRSKRFGLAPLPKAKPEAQTNDNPPKADDDPNADKVAKSKKTMGTINRDRALILNTTADLQAELAAFLKQEGVLIAEEITAAWSEIGKADTNESLTSKILNKITFGRWRKLADLFGEKLGIVAKDGAAEALVQVGVEQNEDMLNQVNERAVDFAKRHGAELVGMQIDDAGNLVTNPNPDFAITDSTRDMLRESVAQAIEEGWSNDRLTDAIVNNHAFSDDRAELIARTETAIADIEGNAIAYDESELVGGEKWLTAPGCCPKCALLNGKIIKIGGSFVKGGYRKLPPLHPRCRCDILPVLPEDMPEDLDQYNAEQVFANISNEILDAHSDGLSRDQLSLGDKAWGKSPAVALRRSKQLFDEMMKQGIVPPDTWAVHAWSIDSKYVSEVLRGKTNTKINPDLRDEFKTLTDDMIERLNNLFADPKARLTDPMLVYRGAGMSADDVSKVRADLDAGNASKLDGDESYQSTTTLQSLAEDFVQRAKKAGDTPVLHVTRLESNVNAIDITRYHYYHPENEVLLGRGHYRLVTGMYERDDGVVVMESVILPVEDATTKADQSPPDDDGFVERYYEDARENAMLGYRHRITTGPSLESLKQYMKK